MSTRLVPCALLALALAAPLCAQQLTPELRENDLVGGQPVKRLLRAVIDDHGVWNAVVLRNSPAHDHNGVLLRDGAPIASEGMPLPEPPGAHMANIYGIEGGGANLSLLVFLQQLAGGVYSQSALLHGGRVVLLGGEPAAVAGLPSSTLCGMIDLLAANAVDTVLASTNLDFDPTDRGLLRFRFAPDGTALVRELVLRTGQTLPDGATVADFARAGVNEHGQWIVRVTTAAGQDRLLTGAGELLRSGTPSPIAGRNLLQLLRHYDLDDFGGWAADALLDGDPASDAVLLANGAVVAQEGDVLPSLAPPAPGPVLREFGQVRLSDSGSVYWQALVGAGSQRKGLFMRDSRAILQAGASQVAGELVTEFANVIDNFEVSPSGRFWLGQVEHATSGQAYVTADFGAAVPRRGCAGNPGTLALAGGLVLAGQTIQLALDGPVGPGALGRVHFSLGAAVPGQDCGIVTPLGEVLISPALALGTVPVGVTTSGPLTLDLALPPSAALVNVKLHAQGSFSRSGGGFTLTNALELEIGAP